MTSTNKKTSTNDFLPIPPACLNNRGKEKESSQSRVKQAGDLPLIHLKQLLIFIHQFFHLTDK
jgi:hypothetical protein